MPKQSNRSRVLVNPDGSALGTRLPFDFLINIKKLQSSRGRYLAVRSKLIELNARHASRTDKIRLKLMKDAEMAFGLEIGDTVEDLVKIWPDRDAHKKLITRWKQLKASVTRMEDRLINEDELIRQLEASTVDNTEDMFVRYLDDPAFVRLLEGRNDADLVSTISSNADDDILEHDTHSSKSGDDPSNEAIDKNDLVVREQEQQSAAAIPAAASTGPGVPQHSTSQPASDAASEESSNGTEDCRVRAREMYTTAWKDRTRTRDRLDKFLANRYLERDLNEDPVVFTLRYPEVFRQHTRECRLASDRYQEAASQARQARALSSNFLKSRWYDPPEDVAQAGIAVECADAMAGTNFPAVEAWIQSSPLTFEVEPPGQIPGRDIEDLASIGFGESLSTIGEGRWKEKVQNHGKKMAQELETVVKTWPPNPSITINPPPLSRPDPIQPAQDET